MLKAESFIFFYITNNIRHRSNIKRRLLLFSDFFRFRGGLGFAAQGLNTHDIVIGLSEYFKNNWLVEVFYVGMTRAQEELILTISGKESEFISGIPESVSVRENAEKKKKTEEWEQMSLSAFLVDNSPAIL